MMIMAVHGSRVPPASVVASLSLVCFIWACGDDPPSDDESQSRDAAASSAHDASSEPWPEADGGRADAAAAEPEAGAGEASPVASRDAATDTPASPPETPPSSGTRDEVTTQGGYRVRTLNNGLKVYSAHDPSTANVAVQVVYKVGSKDDPAGRSGFAHLFEHLMFKATRNLPNEALDRLTEDVGGNNNASTWDDGTLYYETVPGNHLEGVLFAEAERMDSLVVDQTNFESERSVVVEELRENTLADPYGALFYDYLPRESFQFHPYRRSTIGSLEDLEAATLDDVQRFHATFYRPDNANLIVIGSFDEAQLDGWLDQYFAPIERPSRELPVNDVREPTRTAARAVTYYRPNVPLPAVVVNWQVPRYVDADSAALAVLDAVLSSGVSSRLYQSLVYEQQIAAESSSFIDQRAQLGDLSLYAVMAEGQTATDGETALLAVVSSLRDELVSDEELEQAKRELVASRLRGREQPLDRAEELGRTLMWSGDAATPEQLLERIQQVSAQDLQRFARTYLTDTTVLTLFYLSDEDKPADAPAEPTLRPTDAPIQLAALAPAEVVEPAPEGERVSLPAPGPEQSVPTPAVSEMRLANGLRVLVAPAHDVPLVSARLSVSAGSSADPAGKAGLATLTAQMLTESTSRRTAPELSAAIEALGATLTAQAGPDFTRVSANSPTEVFEQTAALLAEVAREPAFTAEDLERVRQQAVDQLSIDLSDPGLIAEAAVSRLLYGSAPYGSPVAGTPQDLPTIVREDVVAVHRARWRPSSATLVMAGDIEPDAAFALAQRLFGDWSDAAEPPAPLVDPAGEPIAARVVLIDQPEAGQAAVYAAVRGPARGDASYEALLVGNAVVGGSYSARLNKQIRIDRGLAYYAYSDLSPRLDDGNLTAYSQTANDTAVEVSDLMLAELARLSTEFVGAEELATRRTTLLGGFSQTLESVDGLSDSFSNVVLYGQPPSALADFATRLRSVTPEQVRAASEALAPDRINLLVVGNGQVIEGGLREKHPNLEVIPITELDLDQPALR